MTVDDVKTIRQRISAGARQQDLAEQYGVCNSNNFNDQNRKATPEMTQITIIGNLTSDPELRFVNSGAAVANFTIASTPRAYDKTAGEWKDGETLFMRCALWRDAAENLAESLTRGTRVIATGKLKTRTFDKDGEKRSVIEMDVEEIGPSLKYSTAKVTKVNRAGGNGFGGKKSADDPWSAAPAIDTEDAPF